MNQVVHKKNEYKEQQKPKKKSSVMIPPDQPKNCFSSGAYCALECYFENVPHKRFVSIVSFTKYVFVENYSPSLASHISTTSWRQVGNIRATRRKYGKVCN